MSVLLDSTGLYPNGASIITTSGGDIYLFIRGGTDSFKVYKSTTSGSSFTNISTVTSTTIHGSANVMGDISAAIDGSGYIHVVSNTSTVSSARDVAYCLFNTSSDTWGTWEQAASRSTDGTSSVDIAIDSSGKPHVFYSTTVSSMGNTYNRMYYTNKTGSSWLTPELVSTSTSISHYDPNIIVRYSNIVEVTYEAYPNTYYRTRTSGTWGTETTISNATNVFQACALTSTSGSNGTVYRYGSSGSTPYENGTQISGVSIESSLTYQCMAASIYGTTRYLFYLNYSNRYLYYTKTSGSGWTTPTQLYTGVNTVTCEWAYNNEYQNGRINFVFGWSGTAYFDYITTTSPPIDITPSAVSAATSSVNPTIPAPIVISPAPATVSAAFSGTFAETIFYTASDATVITIADYSSYSRLRISWTRVEVDISNTIIALPEYASAATQVAISSVNYGSLSINLGAKFASIGTIVGLPIVIDGIEYVLYRWDGSQWVPATFLVYDNGWIEKPVFAWIDNEWKQVG